MPGTTEEHHPAQHTQPAFSSRTPHTSKPLVFSVMAQNLKIQQTLFKEGSSWKESWGERDCVCINFLMQLFETSEQFFYSERHCKSVHFSPPPLLPAWGRPPSPPTYKAPTAFFWSSSSPLLRFIFQITQSNLFLKSRSERVIPLPKAFYLLNGLQPLLMSQSLPTFPSHSKSPRDSPFSTHVLSVP